MYIRFLVFFLLFSLAFAKPIEDIEEEEEGIRVVCPEDGSRCYATGDEEFGLLRPIDLLKAIEEALDESRNVIIDKERKWFGGIVPYIYHEDFSEEDKARIEAAMTIISQNTCVKFRHYQKGDSVDKVVYITAQRGCRATVGYKESRRRHNLNLHQTGCLGRVGTIMHEILHILGLKHEHARPDRDDYVRVMWENIKEGHKKNFVKSKPKEYTTYSVPYNYDSVMHYTADAFSKNGQPTIVPLDSTVNIKRLGQRKRITAKDMKKINVMYNCKEFL